MNKTTSLYQMIKLLSNGEKRYFKNFIEGKTGSENSAYIRLFDHIDRSKRLDEGNINQIFKGLYGNQFSRLKNYLYEQILAAMRSYHAESNRRSKLISDIQNIEFLLSKQLLEEASEIIGRIKKSPESKFYLEEYLKVLRLEVKLYELKEDPGSTITVLKEMDLISENLQNEYFYLRASSQTFEIELSKGIIREDKEKLLIQQSIMQDPRLSDIEEAKTVWGKIKFCDVWIRSAYLTNDTKLRYKYTLQLMKCVEEDRHLKDLHPDYYIGNALLNVVLTAVDVKDYVLCIETIKKIRRMTSRYAKQLRPEFKTRIWLITHIAELKVLRSTKQYDKLKENTQGFTETLPEYLPQIAASYQLMAYNIVAESFFKLEQYREALSMVNKILNHEYGMELRRNIFVQNKLLSLILHYILGNQEFLAYAVKSTYYYLRKMERLYDFERTVLKLITQLPRVNSKQEEKAFFANACHMLQENCKDEFSKTILEDSPIIDWLKMNR